MFDFENIAFTKSLKIDQHKYLTCADCEIEIVGIQNLPGYEPDPNVIYVSVNRVSYVPKEGSSSTSSAFLTNYLGALAQGALQNSQNQNDGETHETNNHITEEKFNNE
jgi:hypothetical protein